MKTYRQSISLMFLLCAAVSACSDSQDGSEWSGESEATGETSQAVITDVAKTIVGLVGKCVDVDYSAYTPQSSTPLKDWRQRFVTDLGRSQEAANPNAALRVFVPVSASASVVVKPRVSSF